jgi:catechol 2,3-dioxygenase-like lactoylglutathione lyase family enzyme
MIAVAFLVAITAAAVAQTAPARPKITGISHLAVYTSDPAATDHYYREIIGATKLPDPENPKGVRYALSSIQFVEALPLPANAGINRLDHTAYNTEDAEGLRKFLASKSWKTPAKVEKGADGSRWFSVLDPEGNKVEFV